MKRKVFTKERKNDIYFSKIDAASFILLVDTSVTTFRNKCRGYFLDSQDL